VIVRAVVEQVAEPPLTVGAVGSTESSLTVTLAL
jgi:hypothetical protein